MITLAQAEKLVAGRQATLIAEMERKIQVFFDVLPDSDLQLIADWRTGDPRGAWLTSLCLAIENGEDVNIVIERYKKGMDEHDNVANDTKTN